MTGAIYSSQKCPVCGSAYKDNHRDGLVCPDHPEQRATKFSVRFGKGIHRRFDSYRLAQKLLTGLRFKVDEGTFDPRDYRKDSPLGFANLVDQWLAVKEREIKSRSHRNVSTMIKRAVDAWGNRNIKTIGYAEIEDFLFDQKHQGTGKPVSDKTRSNIRYALHSFWMWLKRRRVIQPNEMPEFPEVTFELGFRNTVDKATQDRILEEVRHITSDIDPKIWLAIKWLTTYISIRPMEMLNIREKDIDLDGGFVFIPHPKEKRPKLVPLLDEDIDLIRQAWEVSRGFPEQKFFRQARSWPGGAAKDAPFGQKRLYNWWRKACRKLGIEGVDLYGGTRHSTAKALRKTRTPEQIKRATMHSTSAAFERYFQLESDDLREIYRDTRSQSSEKKKLVKFKQ